MTASWVRWVPRYTGYAVCGCALALAGSTVGAGSATAASPTVPTAPTITSARATGSRAITVTFIGPSRDGGSPITSYRAVCASTRGDGITGAHNGPSSPLIVQGLTAGTAYRCTVSARNAVGAGASSAASASVVTRPRSPGPPRSLSVRPIGTRTVAVSFTKPIDDGGARVSGYRATCTPTHGGLAHAAQGAASPINVARLASGETYTCTVAAINNIGTGTPSSPSSPVIPRPTAPTAPTLVSAKTAGHRSITIAFTEPADDGGAPITHYRVTCASSDGGASSAHVGASSPVTVNGLTAKKHYTCTVTASNHVRYGPPSQPSKLIAVTG